MTISNIYSPEEQEAIQKRISIAVAEAEKRGVHPRYFIDIAKQFNLAERLEREVDRYLGGELREDGPTSDVELANFFRISRYSVQCFLKTEMDETKRDIKADACLVKGREVGWGHLKNSGKILPLTDPRVQEKAIEAIKRKWGKI